jgi:hypothetical protein
MKTIALSVALSTLVATCGLIVYDRLVVRPGRLVGVVDVSEIYRTTEAEFSALLTASKSDEERQRALDLANALAKRLSAALDELPADCQCLVMLKSAVAGTPASTLDLTPLLKAKLERERRS